jgi:SOS response regulatory protein OraA/RecX
VAGRRHVDALTFAGRALEGRDLSVTALTQRLRRAGVEEGEIAETIVRLTTAGYLDDGRVSLERARRLSERGYGDAAIDARLRREGIGREARAAALAELEPEPTRAARLAAGLDAKRLAATLSSRGFAEDSIDAALARLDGHTGAEIR